MNYITNEDLDPTSIFFFTPNTIFRIENIQSPFSDSERKEMTTKKKTTRIKPNPGVNAVGSTTVQFQLVCGCKMEQRLDYKNTTQKRFRKTLLAKIYPEQPSQKDTQVTGTSFYTLVADPKCVTHHPNPRNPLTDSYEQFRNTGKSWILNSPNVLKPSFVSIVTDLTNVKLTETQQEALISILEGREY